MNLSNVTTRDLLNELFDRKMLKELKVQLEDDRYMRYSDQIPQEVIERECQQAIVEVLIKDKLIETSSHHDPYSATSRHHARLYVSINPTQLKNYPRQMIYEEPLEPMQPPLYDATELDPYPTMVRRTFTNY